MIYLSPYKETLIRSLVRRSFFIEKRITPVYEIIPLFYKILILVRIRLFICLAAATVVSPSAAAEQKNQDQPAAVIAAAHTSAIISISPSATTGENQE